MPDDPRAPGPEPLDLPPAGEADEAGVSSDPEPSPTDRLARFNLRGRSLREHAARGVMINTGFLAGLSFLGFIRGFVLAAFLTQEDYGIYGITFIALNLVTRLRQVGIGDKFIQQDEEDQEAAFQKAFTIELMLAAVTMVLVAGTMPLMAFAYDQPDMVLPGLLVAVNIAAGPLTTPLWVYYRRMQFFQQRIIQAIDPVVSFVVAVGLAIAGAGYWSIFIGISAGMWTTAIVSVARSPYPLRLRYDRGTLREYWAFSGPLALAAIGGPLIAQVSVFTTETHLGLAAVGALTLAQTITQFTDRVNGLVTGTLYPAICAVRERTDLLLESFIKSNRLALMWAVPFGVGLSLFCDDLVRFGLGEKWEDSVPLLQVFGVIAAIGHIGFNWDAYFRARAETKPMMVAALAAAFTFALVGIPLILWLDFDGLLIALALQMIVHVACRAYFLRRLFDGFGFLGHATRAMLPVVPAALAVLLARQIESGGRTEVAAIAELVAFGLLVLAATWWFERGLLREALGYVRSRPAPGAG